MAARVLVVERVVKQRAALANGGVLRDECDLAQTVRALVRLVLIHHLEAIPVDVIAVQEVDVLIRAVVAPEGNDRVILDAPCLVDDRERRVRDVLRAEAPPLGVGELDAVQLLDALPEVGDERGLGVDDEPAVALVRQDVDELVLELGLRLVGAVRDRGGGRLGADRRLRPLQDEAVGRRPGGGVLGDGVVDSHETPSS